MIGAITLIAGAALTLLLLGDYQLEQLIAAGAMAGIALVWSIMIRRSAGRPLRFSAAHISPWLRAMSRLPRDTATVGAVLVRAAVNGGSPGRAETRAFHFGEDADPTDRGRRATAVLAGSLTPNAIVVRAASGEADALVHEMSHAEQSPQPEWLA